MKENFGVVVNHPVHGLQIVEIKQEEQKLHQVYYHIGAQFKERLEAGDRVSFVSGFAGVKDVVATNIKKTGRESVYVIKRERDGTVIGTVNDDYPLRHVGTASPTGFEYGYGGSGPADLAMSVLADYFDEQPSKSELYHGRIESPCDCTQNGSHPADPECMQCDGTGLGESKPLQCWEHHQAFKWQFIAPRDSSQPFVITEGEIERWLEQQALDRQISRNRDIDNGLDMGL